MTTVSAAVLDKINKAEADLQVATEADATVATAKAAADTAMAAEDDAKQNAATLHSAATASATDAIAALKAELGLS